jgi:hypothetical protein
MRFLGAFLIAILFFIYYSSPALAGGKKSSPPPVALTNEGPSVVQPLNSASCLILDACVDGSDFFTFLANHVAHSHRGFEQVGNHAACPPTLKMSPAGGFLITPAGGAVMRFMPGQKAPLNMNFFALQSFQVLQGDPVRVSKTSNNILLIDDDSNSGPHPYRVQVCGGGALFPGAQAQFRPSIGTFLPGLTSEAEIDSADLDSAQSEETQEQSQEESQEESQEQSQEESQEEADVDSAISDESSVPTQRLRRRRSTPVSVHVKVQA